MGKVVIIPARPEFDRMSRQRRNDPRYLDGQRLLVNAMMYLVKADPEGNRTAVELLSEHVRTQFRMSDRPASALTAE